MTWDAYNRRKEVLHEVLAIADRQRGEVNATKLLAEVAREDRAFTSEVELLLDAHMVWFQALSSHMDRTVFLGDGNLESAAINAWQNAAADMPIIRGLLDANVDMPELQDAFVLEHRFLARAVGTPANHPDLDGLGKRVKEAAFETMVYAPVIPDNPAGIFSRIREALAA
ncbi:MAG: hypothetical protein ABIR57_03045 [Aeromicrobium sp.]